MFFYFVSLFVSLASNKSIPRYSRLLCVAGEANLVLPPPANVLVKRKLHEARGTELHLPSRYLAGLIPSVLCERFVFWQSQSNTIYGEANGDEQVRLVIELRTHGKADSSGQGRGAATGAIVRHNADGTVHTLLNVLGAPSGSSVARLCAVLTRIESLSHCLFWSRADSTKCVLIEMPRLGLSFSRRIDPSVGTAVIALFLFILSFIHDGVVAFRYSVGIVISTQNGSLSTMPAKC